MPKRRENVNHSKDDTDREQSVEDRGTSEGARAAAATALPETKIKPAFGEIVQKEAKSSGEVN